jgi:hypothetical protein
MDYLNHPIFLLPPDWSTDPELGSLHPNESEVYFGPGLNRDLAASSRWRARGTFTAMFPAETWELISFFNDRMGRLKPFWVPSWSADLKITRGFDADDEAVVIAAVGYLENWLPSPAAGRHLFISWPDGAFVCRKAIDAIAGPNDDEETITLNAAVGAAGGPECMVSFLHFARFDIDELKLQYETLHICAAELSFLTVWEEAP